MDDDVKVGIEMGVDVEVDVAVAATVTVVSASTVSLFSEPATEGNTHLTSAKTMTTMPKDSKYNF